MVFFAVLLTFTGKVTWPVLLRFTHCCVCFAIYASTRAITQWMPSPRTISATCLCYIFIYLFCPFKKLKTKIGIQNQLYYQSTTNTPVSFLHGVCIEDMLKTFKRCHLPSVSLLNLKLFGDLLHVKINTKQQILYFGVIGKASWQILMFQLYLHNVTKFTCLDFFSKSPWSHVWYSFKMAQTHSVL